MVRWCVGARCCYILISALRINSLKGQQEMPAIKQQMESNRSSEGQPQPSGSNAGHESGADLGTMLASRCNTQQRPYKWLLLWTGAEVGLTFLLLLWMVYRAPSGLLNWLAIQCAIVLVLVVVSIYAGMQLQGISIRSFILSPMSTSQH
jgi:hypothetical protein